MKYYRVRDYGLLMLGIAGLAVAVWIALQITIWYLDVPLIIVNVVLGFLNIRDSLYKTDEDLDFYEVDIEVTDR